MLLKNKLQLRDICSAFSITDEQFINFVAQLNPHPVYIVHYCYSDHLHYHLGVEVVEGCSPRYWEIGTEVVKSCSLRYWGAEVVKGCSLRYWGAEVVKGCSPR